MFDHDPKDDPYQYDRAGRKLQNVIVDLTDKVDADTVKRVIDCLQRGTPFVLYADSGEMTYFIPAKLWSFSKPGSITQTYDTPKDLLHAVKLSLLTMNMLFIPTETDELPGGHKLIVET